MQQQLKYYKGDNLNAFKHFVTHRNKRDYKTIYACFRQGNYDGILAYHNFITNILNDPNSIEDNDANVLTRAIGDAATRWYQLICGMNATLAFTKQHNPLFAHYYKIVALNSIFDITTLTQKQTNYIVNTIATYTDMHPKLKQRKHAFTMFKNQKQHRNMVIGLPSLIMQLGFGFLFLVGFVLKNTLKKKTMAHVTLWDKNNEEVFAIRTQLRDKKCDDLIDLFQYYIYKIQEGLSENDAIEYAENETGVAMPGNSDIQGLFEYLSKKNVYQTNFSGSLTCEMTASRNPPSTILQPERSFEQLQEYLTEDTSHRNEDNMEQIQKLKDKTLFALFNDIIQQDNIFNINMILPVLQNTIYFIPKTYTKSEKRNVLQKIAITLGTANFFTRFLSRHEDNNLSIAMCVAGMLTYTIQRIKKKKWYNCDHLNKKGIVSLLYVAMNNPIIQALFDVRNGLDVAAFFDMNGIQWILPNQQTFKGSCIALSEFAKWIINKIRPRKKHKSEQPKHESEQKDNLRELKENQKNKYHTYCNNKKNFIIKEKCFKCFNNHNYNFLYRKCCRINTQRCEKKSCRICSHNYYTRRKLYK